MTPPLQRRRRSRILCLASAAAAATATAAEDRRSVASVAVDPRAVAAPTPQAPLLSSASALADAFGNASAAPGDGPAAEALAPLDCGLWLAPSTIPGAGLGLYAGRAFRTDELLQPTGDLALSIVDLRLHLQHANRSAAADDAFDGTFLWDEYTWNAKALQMDHEGYADVNAASMGFGAAANCFLPLLNVEEWYPHPLNPQRLHRARDPGAGAVSPYGNRTTTAARDLAPGEELFVSYGENWFVTRPTLGAIPLTGDLDHADRLLRQYRDLVNHTSHKLAPATAERLWTTLVGNSSFTESRVLGAFGGTSPEELDQLLRRNKTLTQLRREQSRRDVDWLRQNGVCGDHIVAGPSTLPQAGMGALAARFLPAGTVVAALPLIHVPDRSILAMYHFDPEALQQGQARPRPDLGVRTHQLLLNYCFGHRESTLLLCPYGPMAGYINHNQTRANVRLQWADPARGGNHMPHLLSQDLRALAGDARAKLAMEVVALRDLQPGEEVLLDYGDDWEAAWQEHLRAWRPVPGADRYRSASDLNADKTTRVPTEFEALADPALARPDVELWCNDAFKRPVWREHHANGTLQQFLKDADSKIYACDNLEVSVDAEGDYRYRVVLWYEDKAQGHPLELIATLADVPREIFVWYDRPYASDTFLPNAFRRHMSIPDHMFPETWRNLKPQGESNSTTSHGGAMV